MSHALDLTPDLLANHAASLKSLVRHILADEHAAEDVVQETWMTALRRPPAHEERLGGWLRTVARTLALKRLRGERRRSERELEAARPDASKEEATELAAERARSLQQLTQAIVGLSEPYRAAIFLRFFEGLPPREIAVRLDVPLATAKSRVARGVARLRDELKRDMGEGTWIQGLILLAGPFPTATPVPIPQESGPAGLASAGSGGAATSTAWLWSMPALAAALVLGISFLAVRANLAPSQPIGSGAIVASVTGGSGQSQRALQAANEKETTAQADGALAGSKRQPLPTPGETAELGFLPLTGTHEYHVSGVVLGAEDRPRSGIQVLLGARDVAPRLAAETDAAGRFSIAWSSDLARAELVLGFSDGNRSTQEVLRLRSGEELELRIGFHEGAEVSFLSRREVVSEVAVHDVHGEFSFVTGGLASANLVRSFELAPGIQTLSTAHRSDQCTPDQHLILGNVERSFGTFELTEVDLEVIEEVPIDGEWSMLENESFGHIVATLTQAPGRNLAGTVRTALGEAAARALVTARIPGGSRVATARTGADGTFAFEGLPFEELELVAGGGRYGQAHHLVPAGEEDTPLSWHPWLDRGLELTGRVIDETGAALTRLIVEVSVTQGTKLTRDAARTDEAGRFVLPNVPDGRVRVHVRKPGEALPLASFEAEGSDLGELVVPMAKERRARVLARLPNQENGARDTTIRLQHLATDRLATMPLQESTNDEPLLALMAQPGAYRIEVGSKLAGYRSAGTLTLRPGETADLGLLVADDEARILLRTDEESHTLELELWRTNHGLPSIAAGFSGNLPSWIALAPGAYQIRVRDPEASEEAAREWHEHELELSPGETRAFGLEEGPQGAQRLKELSGAQMPPEEELAGEGSGRACFLYHTNLRD